MAVSARIWSYITKTVCHRYYRNDCNVSLADGVKFSLNGKDLVEGVKYLRTLDSSQLDTYRKLYKVRR